MLVLLVLLLLPPLLLVVPLLLRPPLLPPLPCMRRAVRYYIVFMCHSSCLSAHAHEHAHDSHSFTQHKNFDNRQGAPVVTRALCRSLTLGAWKQACHADFPLTSCW